MSRTTEYLIVTDARRRAERDIELDREYDEWVAAQCDPEQAHDLALLTAAAEQVAIRAELAHAHSERLVEMARRLAAKLEDLG